MNKICVKTNHMRFLSVLKSFKFHAYMISDYYYKNRGKQARRLTHVRKHARGACMWGWKWGGMGMGRSVQV